MKLFEKKKNLISLTLFFILINAAPVFSESEKEKDIKKLLEVSGILTVTGRFDSRPIELLPWPVSLASFLLGFIFRLALTLVSGVIFITCGRFKYFIY